MITHQSKYERCLHLSVGLMYCCHAMTFHVVTQAKTLHVLAASLDRSYVAIFHHLTVTSRQIEQFDMLLLHSSTSTSILDTRDTVTST